MRSRAEDGEVVIERVRRGEQCCDHQSRGLEFATGSDVRHIHATLADAATDAAPCAR